ncbi:hypothetical protein GWK47_016619 [Chionoecetes opilio]|uniref:Uncharacterized protein n=1 Tax=Chionoecetes opilio TaxID=41210 RepID=A0A8J4XWF4_CHIOP|nr:hypothetical protein GWK47_016619 [Chionoecetes opilio]
MGHQSSTDHRTTVALVNQVLETITSWGRRCQVDLPQDKTQVMLISRRHHPPATPIPPILLDGKVLPLQPTVNILGVEVNSTLSFTSHVRKTASRAAGRLNCVRRVSHLLDARGVTTLYAAQVRSLMDLYSTGEGVAGLCVTYKILQAGRPHLAYTPAAVGDTSPILHQGRPKEGTNNSLFPFPGQKPSSAPSCRDTAGWWNGVVRQTHMHQAATTHIFKCAVNAWLMPSGYN